MAPLIAPDANLLIYAYDDKSQDFPGPSHWSIFRRLSLDVDARANLSTDAHLAALSIEHDATLYSKDQDFARFPGLRWINPLTDHV